MPAGAQYASPTPSTGRKETATQVSSLSIAAGQLAVPSAPPLETSNGTVIQLVTGGGNDTLQQSFVHDASNFKIKTRPRDELPRSVDEATLLRIRNEESVLKKRREEESPYTPVSDQMSPLKRGTGTPLLRRDRIKMMIVGDSISQGMEGDWTWRYRLWEWLKSQNEDFEFVGPWIGTRQSPDETKPPSPPEIFGEPVPEEAPLVSGGYADGVDSAFETKHFALWGRQAAEAKTEIKKMVEEYEPTYLLVLLGFNDLGWFVSGPEGTLASIKSIVDESRAANPNINIILGDVVQRSAIDFRADLPVITDQYNALLRAAVPKWNTAVSPVAMAFVRDTYGCETQACPSGHDGLHPNALGEFQIARAFSLALVYGFGIGTDSLSIPASVSGRPNPVPLNVMAYASPYGITVTWFKVYGARKYGVRSRYKGLTDWNEGTAFTNRFDNTWVIAGSHFEYQIRVDNEIDGTSDWSDIVDAIADPKTLQGPSTIHASPTENGVHVSWSAVDGAEFYAALLFDSDLPGAWLSVVGVRGLSYTWESQYVGHRHVVAVQAWNDIGGGLPTLGRNVIPGTTDAPTAPTNLYIDSVDATTVQLSWCGDCSDTSYKLYTRSLNTDLTNLSDWSGSDAGSAPATGVAYLVPGVWNYEFAVTALNGDLESPMSDGLQAYYPGYTRGGGECKKCTTPEPAPNDPVPETSPSVLPIVPVLGGGTDYKLHDCGEVKDKDGNEKDGRTLWRELGASAAWEDAVAYYNNGNKERQFSQTVASFFNASGLASTMDCRSLNVDNGCGDASIACENVNYPAGYVILNSMANLDALFFQLYSSITDASTDVWQDAEKISSTFNPPPPSDDTALFILGLVQNVWSMALSPGLGKVLTTTFGEAGKSKAFDKVNEFADIGFEKIGEAIGPVSNPVSTASAIQDQLHAVSTLWLNATDQINNAMFDGQQNSITNLREIIDDGGFMVRQGEGAFDMRAGTETPLYAQVIPLAWSYDRGDPPINPSGVFILDWETACKTDDDCPDNIDWLPNGAAKRTCHCYKENMYFLVQLWGSAESPGSYPSNTPSDNIFNEPPGLDDLDGRKWGGLTLVKFIEGSVNTYIANGRKNGYTPDFKDDEIMQAYVDEASDHNAVAPGVVQIPVCPPREAWDNWDEVYHGNPKSEHYPCN
ncbi:uncharacterized protein TRUGW13939_06320 [Talaromyces rugulosus]|uniref:Fibronectin type-III domain-containing protein n=1 Tax=Talaromyces rugulosus TaxID=121627 RepID=A0A7H8QZS5_TALRU|nr:uncharacterized protein TRUGW13939_06320 [Talaromyces rugulosus]QKX59188.1 hypothetical protein TRUGW13939_06320 [Talaromyces rugulosus]